VTTRTATPRTTTTAAGPTPEPGSAPTRPTRTSERTTPMTTEPRRSAHPDDPRRYVAPGRFDTVFNTAVAWLTAHGLSLFGSRVLTVAGRTTGEPRSTPVNLLVLDGERYLVSPRGHTQWVRNVRVAGRAELRVGRRTEHVTLTELPVEQRLPVLRVYLERWGWEVGRFVEGLTKDSTDAEVDAVAPGMPVFRVTTVTTATAPTDTAARDTTA
jgi:deazaflavin-dependent oxidoreductase (nitroreductase family)